ACGHDPFQPRRQIEPLARWPADDFAQFQHEFELTEVGIRSPDIRCRPVPEIADARKDKPGRRTDVDEPGSARLTTMATTIPSGMSFVATCGIVDMLQHRFYA